MAGQKATKRLVVLCSPEEYDEVEAEVKRLGYESKSALVRQGIALVKQIKQGSKA